MTIKSELLDFWEIRPILIKTEEAGLRLPNLAKIRLDLDRSRINQTSTKLVRGSLTPNEERMS